MKSTVIRPLSWLLIIGIFLFALLWEMRHPSEKEASRFYQKMMAMNTAALQEGVVFAHMNFHTKQGTKNPAIDLLEVAGEALDFNQYGFPVGVSHTKDTLTLPMQSKHCREVFNTLLMPMRPILNPDNDYHLSVESINGRCIYRSALYYEQKIVYNPLTGQVQLVVL